VDIQEVSTVVLEFSLGLLGLYGVWHCHDEAVPLLPVGLEVFWELHPKASRDNTVQCRINIFVTLLKIGQHYFLFLVEVGSNTSTVALRVVGDDEKGSLESETVKYGRESHGTRAREWLCWRRPAATVNDRPALSSETAPHINKAAIVR
jgi:hypothetical protein